MDYEEYLRSQRRRRRSQMTKPALSIETSSKSSEQDGPNNLDEADLYVKEFIKVEAIISPKIRKQFLIPINIPCGETRSSRRSSETGDGVRSENVGKIKLRNIAELRHPTVEEEPPQANINIPPPCFCYHCIPSYHNKYIPARPRPQLYSSPDAPPNVWRPF